MLSKAACPQTPSPPTSRHQGPLASPLLRVCRSAGSVRGGGRVDKVLPWSVALEKQLDIKTK